MLTNSIKKINKIELIQEYEKKKRQKKFNLKLLSKINLNYLPRNSELTLSSKFVACPLKDNIFGGKSARRYRDRGFQNTASSSSQPHVNHLVGRRKRAFYGEEMEMEEDDEEAVEKDGQEKIYSLIHINDIYYQNNNTAKNCLRIKDTNLDVKQQGGLAFANDLKYKFGLCLNHKDPITAVTMSSSIVDSCSFFISCSKSKLIISLINVVNLELIHEEEIETGFGEVDWVTIDRSDQWIAMGVDRDIYVVEWSTLKIVKLEGHKERVTNVLFFYTLADPSQDYQSFLCLLSLSEDRTFI
eukprot:jgi/Orpsp1_1/1188000/evm.model.d7180000061768.1